MVWWSPAERMDKGVTLSLDPQFLQLCVLGLGKTSRCDGAGDVAVLLGLRRSSWTCTHTLTDLLMGIYPTLLEHAFISSAFLLVMLLTVMTVTHQGSEQHGVHQGRHLFTKGSCTRCGLLSVPVFEGSGKNNRFSGVPLNLRGPLTTVSPRQCHQNSYQNPKECKVMNLNFLSVYFPSQHRKWLMQVK